MPRPKGSKNVIERGVRITPTVSKKSFKWLYSQAESYGKVIDRLVKSEIKKSRA